MATWCRWCGLESMDDAICQWCGRLFPPPPPSVPDDAGAVDDSDQLIPYLPALELRLESFLAVACPTVALGMAVAHVARIPAESLCAATSLCVCFFLSMYQVVESVDEHWAPVGFAAIAELLFGPVPVIAIFATLWLFLRRNDVGTVVTLLGVHIVTVLLVAYAAVPELGPAMEMAALEPGRSFATFTFLAGVLGWVLANFWRPLNE